MTKMIGFPTLIPAGVMTPTVAKIHVLTVLLLVTSTCLAARPRAPLPELQRAAAALVRRHLHSFYRRQGRSEDADRFSRPDR